MSEVRSESASESVWQGNRVRLRAIEPEDWQTFFDWNQDSEAARGMYYIPFPGSQESMKRWAEKLATAEPDDDKFFFVVETNEGEVLGSINAHSCEPHHGTFAYGIGIRREHQHKGYASEAILLLLRYFFLELRYQKATVEVYSFNDRSVKMHERLGFQLEGRLRRMIFTRGRHYDKLVFGMTVEEFTEKHGDAFPQSDQDEDQA